MIVSGMLSEHSRQTAPDLVAEVADTVNNLDLAGLAIAARSVLVERTSVVDDLPRITAPALVIAGAEDRALPATPHSTQLADGIADARLEILPRAGHLAPREAPAEVAALLDEFLTSLHPKRSPM